MNVATPEHTARLSCYTGRQITLLSRHAKERVMEPIFDARLGAKLCVDFGYHTDQLGTFTREIPRVLSQYGAAARKTHLATERTGLPIGVGSFGADSYLRAAPWNVELVVLVDVERDIEIAGTDRGRATFPHLVSSDWSAIETFTRDQGFPSQQRVVRPDDADDPRVQKDTASWPSLQSAFAWARRLAGDGRVFVETDGRAFANPNRMARIASATEDLARRLLSCCHECGTPGFRQIDRKAGLPCATCAAPTRETLEITHGCLKCAHRVSRPDAPGARADPGHCDECNP